MTKQAAPAPKIPVGLPIKIWRHAGFSGILYLAIVFASVIGLRHYLSLYATSELAHYLSDTAISKSTSLTILKIVDLVLWLPVIPVILTAFLIPIRLVWIFGRLDFSTAIAQSGDAFRTTGIMLNLTFRRLVLLMAPLAAMYFFYGHMLAQSQSEHFLRVYILACVVVGIPIIWRAVPIIGALFIAILSRCYPGYALEQSQFILDGKSGILMMLMALTGVFVGSGYQASWQLNYGTPEYFVAISGSILAAAYCITAIAIICLKSAQDYARSVNMAMMPQYMNTPNVSGDLGIVQNQ